MIGIARSYYLNYCSMIWVHIEHLWWIWKPSVKLFLLSPSNLIQNHNHVISFHQSIIKLPRTNISSKDKTKQATIIPWPRTRSKDDLSVNERDRTIKEFKNKVIAIGGHLVHYIFKNSTDGNSLNMIWDDPDPVGSWQTYWNTLTTLSKIPFVAWQKVG